MEERGFSVGNCLKEGLRLMRGHFVFFALFLLIEMFIGLFPMFVQWAYPDLWWLPILTIVCYILQLGVYIGFIRSALRVVDGDHPTYKDLYRNFDRWIYFFIASLLYGIVVFIGLLLLIFPGIIWAARYYMYPFLVVDKKLGPLQALEESGRMTYGAKWDVCLMMLAIFFINLVGALCLGVGLLFTIPMTLFAQLIMYRQLKLS